MLDDIHLARRRTGEVEVLIIAGLSHLQWDLDIEVYFS